MLRAYFIAWTFWAGIMVLGAGVASGQNYPNKPIRIVTTGAGGNLDLVARQIAMAISGPLGVPVIVDNRGAGNSASEAVANSPPDGYALLLNSSALWLAPFVQAHVPFDPVRDFAPVALAVRTVNVLVVHPSLPVKSVKELIALAKAKPGELNYGSSGSGTSSHLSAELFKAMAGVNIVRVNYKSGGVALNDLISGQVQMVFPLASTALPHVKSGRLKALAVTSAQPSALAPGWPTVAATGLPGFESASINGVFASAKTPPPVINRLNEEMVRALSMPEIKERLLNAGVEAVGGSSEQLAAAMKSEMARMGKVIKDAGIRAE